MVALAPSRTVTTGDRDSRKAEKKDFICAAYPFSANQLDVLCTTLARIVVRLKSSAPTPKPGAKASTRSPPEVRLPTVQ